MKRKIIIEVVLVSICVFAAGLYALFALRHPEPEPIGFV
jgi:hypothetical protein